MAKLIEATRIGPFYANKTSVDIPHATIKREVWGDILYETIVTVFPEAKELEIRQSRLNPLSYKFEPVTEKPLILKEETINWWRENVSNWLPKEGNIFVRLFGVPVIIYEPTK